MKTSQLDIKTTRKPTNYLINSNCLGTIGILTKNSNTPCHASKLAFFVPKIFQNNQAWLFLEAFICMKNEDRILKYGRVKGRIKDLFGGNKSNRVTAISDTRPPDSKTGGLTKNSNGGQIMPFNHPKRHSIGGKTLTLNLTSNGFVKSFFASRRLGHWYLAAVTTRGQIGTICDHQKHHKTFSSLDQIDKYLASQNISNLSGSFLDLTQPYQQLNVMAGGVIHA